MSATEMNPAILTCVNCRRELTPAALFCPSCGTPRVRDGDSDELIGKILGERFLVLERMGHGKSGSIYRAEHVTLRRRVAIKVLHHELSRDDLAIERFRREATSVAEIDNEHIVEIHDFGRTPDGRLYLAMELLEGETLDATLARAGRMPIDAAVDVLIQTGEALVEAHSVGFVHRDLRPRNVFLSVRRGKANFVKLLDFGLSKLVEGGGVAASTSLGMTFGDPRYMSPEQAKGDAIDRRADLYSLGCIAFEMLTAEPPFAGGKVFDVLTRHVNEPPRPLRTVRPDVPEWLEVAIARTLAKRPEARYVTAARLVAALRHGVQHGTVLAEEAAVPAGVEPAGASRSGPTGTPAVGVPVMPAAPRAAPVSAPIPVPVLDPTASERVIMAPAMPETAPVAAPAARAREEGFGTSDDHRAQVRPKVRAAAGAAAAIAPGAPLVPAAPAVPLESNISGVWFAAGDGDQLGETGAMRLERARDTIATGDSLYEENEPEPSPLKKIFLIAGGLAAVLVIAVMVFGGGGRKVQSAAPGAVTPDPAGLAGASGLAAAPGAVAAVDAGIAEVATEVAVAPTPPVRASEPTTTARVPARTARSPERTVAPERPERTERTIDDPGPGPAPGPVEDEAVKMAEFYAKAGEAALRGGDPVGAAGNFQKALASNAGNVDAVIGLGEVALQQGLYGDALRHLKKAAKLAPRRGRVHTLLGEAHLNSGNAALAEQSFKKALQIDPDDARARNGYNEAAGRLPPPTDD